jgi:5S rRNA maturation endonuclease (ribonuclease M5)/KaiC/GvpD/RAD55 family RecA-like ATPase
MTTNFDIGRVAKALLGPPNQHLSGKTELRYGTRGSLSVDLAKDAWYDHEANKGGDILDLIMRERGGARADAKRWMDYHFGASCGGEQGFDEQKINGAAHRQGSRIVATYDYVDERGEALFQVVRFEPKDFRQRRSDGKDDWIWNLDGVRRVLYRLPELIETIANDHVVFVVEGEKDVESLRKLNITGTTCPGGANKWRPEFNQCFAGADVVIIPDADEPGRKHAESVATHLSGVAKRIRLIQLKEKDVSGWLAAGGTRDQLIKLINQAPEYAEPGQSQVSRFKPLTLAEFFSLAIKPRGMVLDPIIPEKGLAMVYAVRGTGKTYLVLGIAYAVATGSQFLKWKAPHARRVLLVDGEMPAAALQERLAKVVQGATAEPADDMLTIISGDLMEEGGVGNLADPKVQAELEPHLEGVELLILDNLSSLTAVIRDNDADSWNPIQAWLLRLRRRGISVLIVHHAGKGGEQRGTSRREDVLDTSISLRRPSDYVPTEGARFEVHLEKARGVHGEPAKPFEAKLEERGSTAVWTMRDIDDANLARVRALLEDDLSVRDIADETGIPKSTVQRLKKKIEGEAGDGE